MITKRKAKLVSRSEKETPEENEEDPTTKHIRILEDRFLFAARRREQIIQDNPNIGDAEMWAVDLDLLNKKAELEAALDDQRRMNRLKNMK